MMGKVSATRPPDHFDIREGLLFTVMLIFAAWVFQRLDNSRYRQAGHRIGNRPVVARR